MTLQPNQPAPLFSAVDQNGNPISLEQFKGKKIVLYFYPKDDTPGCTAQACNLRDHHSQLIELGYQVIGVSTDNVKSHKKFEEKYQLPFPLIADEDKNIVHQYGVWGERSFLGKKYMGIARTTFLIDEQLVIKAILTKPNTKDQTQQVLATWATV